MRLVVRLWRLARTSNRERKGETNCRREAGRGRGRGKGGRRTRNPTPNLMDRRRGIPGVAGAKGREGKGRKGTWFLF